MRAGRLLLSSAALVAAACDSAPTAPGDRPSARPAEITGGFGVIGIGWILNALPFRPLAINDAGAIVGTQNGNAVLWQSGTLTVLPTSSIAGPYEATAISPSGVIAGDAGGIPLVWYTPTSSPHGIPQRHLLTHVVAVSDVGIVLGNDSGGWCHDAFTWSASGGLTVLGDGASTDWACAAGMDAAARSCSRCPTRSTRMSKA